MNCSALLAPLVLIALCAPVTSEAQTQPSSPQDLMWTASGRVIDQATTSPVANAQVTATQEKQGASSPTVVRGATDQSGAFRLQGTAGGQYRLSVSHPSYFDGRYGSKPGNAMGTPVAFAPGQETKGLDVRLIRPAAISGRVLNEAGEPVSSVNVTVLVQRRRQGRINWAPASTSAITRTNDRGEYRAFGLQPGRYAVLAAMLRHGASGPEGGTNEAYGSVFYQNEKDLSRAQVLHLQSGADLAGIDLLVRKTEVFHVTGKVDLPPEQEFASASLLVSPSSMPFVRTGVPIRPDGAFELRNLEAGSYVLFANIEGNGRRWTTHSLLEVTDRNIENLSLQPQSSYIVTGKVSISGSEQDLAGVMITLRSTDDHVPFSTVSGKSAKNGSFTVQRVVGQTYRVHVTPPHENLYLKSAKADGADVTEKDFPVRGPLQLELVLAGDAGAVEGEVRNQETPAVGAMVALVPKRNRRNLPEYYRLSSSDSNGRFRIAGVVPGEYVLLSFDDVDPEECYDPEFLRQYERKGSDVVVAPAGKQEVSQAVIETK
jgi:hypothetical protein